MNNMMYDEQELLSKLLINRTVLYLCGDRIVGNVIDHSYSGA